MKHASATTLDRLDSLLTRLRAIEGLTERSRGIFYRKGRAFLHFHEDPAGIFADLRNEAGADFDRFEVSGGEAQDALVEVVEERARAR